MRPREGRPAVDPGGRDLVQGLPGLRVSSLGDRRSLTGHHLAGPPALSPLPFARSPHPRHPFAGKGSFPAPAAPLPSFQRGYLLQKQGKGRGPGREATCRREGRSPRLGGWAAAAVSSRSPAHSAAITVRRGRLPGRPPPPPQGHGGAKSKAPPLTCSRGSLADKAAAARRDEIKAGGRAGGWLGEAVVLRVSGLCPTHALRSAFSASCAHTPAGCNGPVQVTASTGSHPSRIAKPLQSIDKVIDRPAYLSMRRSQFPQLKGVQYANLKTIVVQITLEGGSLFVLFVFGFVFLRQCLARRLLKAWLLQPGLALN